MTARPGSLWSHGVFALGLLAGLCFLGGGAWDVAWHVDRGRDGFWSPPHLLIYGGLALGVAMPLVALLVGRPTASRPERELAGPTIRLLGARLSPAALVGGLGALLAIGAGPFDEAWHQLFGLDVTIWSPPHLQLIAGAFATVLGVVIGLSGEINRARADGATQLELPEMAQTLGFALMLNIALATLGEFHFGVPRFPFYWHPILLPLVVLPTLAAAARAGGPWGATRAAVGSTLVGVGLRVLLLGVGRSATFVTLALLPAAVAFDLLMRLRRGGWAWPRPELAGALATLVLLYSQVDYLRAPSLVTWPLGRMPWIVVVALLFGAAAAGLGHRLGAALRPAPHRRSAPPGRVWIPVGAASAAAGALVLVAALPSVAAADNITRLSRGVGLLSSSPSADLIQLAGTVFVLLTVLVATVGSAIALRAVERDAQVS
jgi:hypothetical protein